MAVIVTRAGKGAALSHAEADANFTNLNDEAATNTAKVTNATHTGDATGAVALTLATVNANVGSFGLAGSVAQITANAKGLITGAANVAIAIASTAITDLTAAIMTLAGVQTVTGDKTFTGAVIVTDNVFSIKDDLDPTKVAQFQASGITTATTRIFTLPDQSATLAMGGGGSNTFTGTNNFNDTSFLIRDDADTTKKVAFQVSGVATGTTRTMTIPDATGTLMLTNTMLLAAQHPAHTGDVTSTAGALALTIAADAVTFPKMVNASVASVLIGRGSLAGAGDLEEVTLGAGLLMTGTVLSSTGGAGTTNLTYTAATRVVASDTGTDATLPLMSSADAGLVPASGGGTVNFLRADGAFAAPTPAPAGSTTQVQYNNAGALAGATEVEIELNQLRLENTSTSTAAAANGSRLVSVLQTPNFATLAMVDQDAGFHPLQFDIAQESIKMIAAVPNANAAHAFGTPLPTAVGTATLAVPASTNIYTQTDVLEYLVTTAATTAVAGFRGTQGMLTVGGSGAGLGGFKWFGRFGPATGVATTTTRCAFGLRALTSAPTDVEPSTLVTCAFFGWDAADANMQFMSNDATGSCTKIDLGASFPVPTADRTKSFDCWLYSPPGTTLAVHYRIRDRATGNTASGSTTVTTDLPAATARLSPFGYCSVGGTSSVIGFGLHSMQWQPIVIN